MLLDRTEEQFKNSIEDYLQRAICFDTAIRVTTEDGKAVLISEAEWQFLRDAFINKAMKSDK